MPQVRDEEGEVSFKGRSYRCAVQDKFCRSNNENKLNIREIYMKYG